MKRNRLPIISMITLFMFWAITVSVLSAVMGSSAGYRTMESAVEGARVASFSVETTDLELMSADTLLDCNQEEDAVSFRFFVRNHSETAVTYLVQVLGVPESVKYVVVNGTGKLMENGGESEVQVTLRPKNTSDRSMERIIRGIRAEVAIAQIEK